MRKILTSIILILLFSIVNAADEKAFILRKKITEAKKKIEEYTEKRKDIEKKLRRFHKGYAQRLNKRKKGINRLRNDVSGLGKELKCEKLKYRRLKNTRCNYEIQSVAFKKNLSDSMNHYKKLVQEGLPHNIDNRLLQLSRLISDTQFENISSEEIFNRYITFLNKELAQGSDSEVYVKDRGKYLRIGWVILTYADDAGKEVGILTRKNGSWIWHNDLDLKTRKAIRDAIKMVEGKKAPALNAFPVPMSLLREKLK